MEIENWFNRKCDSELKMYAFSLPFINVVYQTDGYYSICIAFLFWTLTWKKE